jgi:hypothetical protein
MVVDIGTAAKLITAYVVSWSGVRLSPLGTSACYTSPGWQMMSVEQSVEWELAGETEVLGENLPQCHFVPLKSHMTRPGFEHGPPRWQASD